MDKYDICNDNIGGIYEVECAEDAEGKSSPWVDDGKCCPDTDTEKICEGEGSGTDVLHQEYCK